MTPSRTRWAAVLAAVWMGPVAGCDPVAPSGPSDRDDTAVDSDLPVPSACSVENAGTLPLGRRTNRALARGLADLLGADRDGGVDVSALPAADVATGYTNTRLDAVGGVSEAFLLAWRPTIARAAYASATSDVSVSVSLSSLVGTAGSEVPSPWGSQHTMRALQWGEGSLVVPFTLPMDGTWDVGLPVSWWLGWEDETLNAITARSTARLLLDGVQVDSWPVSAAFDTPKRRAVKVDLAAGPHTLELQPLWTGVGLPEGLTYAWILGNVEAHLEDAPTVPLSIAGTSVSCATGTSDDLVACAEPVLFDVARRAGSLPSSEVDLSGPLTVLRAARDAGAPPEEAIALALETILLSPRLLFLPTPSDDGALPPHAMAERLADTLWRSVPDVALLDCADADGLGVDGAEDDPCTLGAQVRRMLDDPRSDALYEDFVHQWLTLEGLDHTERDPALYPFIQDAAFDSMREEIRRIVLGTLAEDAPVRDLLDSPTHWVDAHLATLYGAPIPADQADAVADGGWFSWEDPTGARRGVLTSAAFLAAHSQSDRTSPVKRGVAILSKILCSPPGPPSPDAGVFSPDEREENPQDVLAQHRSDPSCNACHKDIDPMGLPLERYDAVGGERTRYANGDTIGHEATLPDGTVFHSPSDLIDAIVTDPRTDTCLAQQLFTWMQGRAPTPEDEPLIEAMASPDHPATFASMIETWVASPQARCLYRP